MATISLLQRKNHGRSILLWETSLAIREASTIMHACTLVKYMVYIEHNPLALEINKFDVTFLYSYVGVCFEYFVALSKEYMCMLHMHAITCNLISIFLICSCVRI
ncbi:hypothetical protein V8G54_030662 [Vigna mungo]|uniref:Uncharacterized protein n=1 Tax=Vigna mungo TaxID=3915 RepID=A0AAQ3MWS6_VIGMU